MHVGYIVRFIASFTSCFRTFGAKVLGIFILMERQFHRNESSWNIHSRGTKVPQKRKFQASTGNSWNQEKIISGKLTSLMPTNRCLMFASGASQLLWMLSSLHRRSTRSGWSGHGRTNNFPNKCISKMHNRWHRPVIVIFVIMGTHPLLNRCFIQWISIAMIPPFLSVFCHNIPSLKKNIPPC